MPKYACCRGADRQDDLINSVKTFLICDDLKPPYKAGNSHRERERGDEMIKVEMDPSRIHVPTSANICQQVTTHHSQQFFSSSSGRTDRKLL